MRSWPGLMSMETLLDTQEANKYVVVTEWESRAHLRHWLKSDLHAHIVKELDDVLDEPVTYRELMHHEDDVFLL